MILPFDKLLIILGALTLANLLIMADTADALAAKSTPKDESANTLSKWSKRWADSKLGWHKQEPHHFLVKYKDHVLAEDVATCSESSHRIFIPLCGKTVDLAFLAKHEAVGEVVGIDGVRKALTEFSDEHPDLELKEADTIKAVERFSGKGITLLRGDMFDLDEEMTGGKFDVVFDRASIVAIRPEMREKYVSVMGKLMKPGGSILLVTIDRREGTEEGTGAGPPFSVNENEVRRLYESQDWVQSITKLDEHNEFKDEESKSRWTMQGVTSLFEPCFLIKAKL